MITPKQFEAEQWERWHRQMNITAAQQTEARQKFESEHQVQTSRDQYGWKGLPGMGGSLNKPKARKRRGAE